MAVTGLAVLILSQSGCHMDWTIPTHKIWNGYCVCGYCNRAEIYYDGVQYRKGECPSPIDCTQAVEVRNSFRESGIPDSIPLFCITDHRGPVDDAISIDECNEDWYRGLVKDCWDTPECVTEDPDACRLAGDITPECLYGLDPAQYPMATSLIGVENLPSYDDRKALAADKLYEKCVEHSHDIPADHRGVPDGTILDRSDLRNCFIPCLWEDPSAEGDADIDPPSTTSRSSIFEIDPVNSYALYVIEGQPEIYAHVSGQFSIDFHPDCIEKGVFCPWGHCPCDVAVSSLYVDTRHEPHELWHVTTDGGKLTVEEFTIINKKWIEGTMSPSGLYTGLMDFDDENIFLYATLDTVEEGRIGMDYPEAGHRQVEYYHDTRAAYMSFTMLPDEAGGVMTIRAYGNIIHEPPVAVAETPVSVACNEPTMRLDATWTTDRDDDITNYLWTLMTSSGEWKDYLGKVLDVPMELPIGETSQVRLDVFDGFGLMDYDFMDVTVGPDDVSPEAEVTLPVSCLWPPNHEKVKFKLDRDILCEVYDICGHDPVTYRIINATSDQPESFWRESPRTEDDITYNETTVCMRAERSIVDWEDLYTGRMYSIALEFRDSTESGNPTTRTIHVRVPYTLTSKDEATCGDFSLLDWVEDDEQECFGNESQYPPAPPPPWCRSSIMDSGKEYAGFWVLLFLAALSMIMVLRRR